MAAVQLGLSENGVVGFGGQQYEYVVTDMELTYSNRDFPRISLQGVMTNEMGLFSGEPAKKLRDFSMGELMADVGRRIKAKENYRSLKR